MTSATELARVAQAADDTITTVRSSLCAGDELFEAVTREFGFGQRDERLRTFLRRIQRVIERAR